MKSHVFKLTGVIVLTAAMCGQGLAQTQTPTVPNVGQLEKSAMKYAVIGAAASVAVGVIALLAHHHKSPDGKKKDSKRESASRRQSPDAANSGQLNGTPETRTVEASQSSSPNQAANPTDGNEK